jgi:hypothetical protein
VAKEASEAAEKAYHDAKAEQQVALEEKAALD